MRNILLFLAIGTQTLARPVPVWFEQNLGQAEKDARFLSRSGGQTLTLGTNGARWKAQGTDVRMQFGDTRRLTGLNRTSGVSNYIQGSDPKDWIRGAPQFGRVQYDQVYPGIDAVFYSRENSWEYDFVVAPGANPSDILLDFSGVDSVQIDDAGDLRMGGSALLHKRPIAYQMRNGKRTLVEASFAIWSRTRVRFSLGAYDPALPLIIDPTTVVSRIINVGSNSVASVSTAGGDMFVAMYILSQGITSSIVTRINPNGGTVYSTTLSSAWAKAVSADSSNQLCVAGEADPGFSTLNAYKPAMAAGDTRDAFVAKLDASGIPVLATFLGGSGAESADAVAIHGGNCWVGGNTRSNDFPVVPSNLGVQYGGGAFDGFLSLVVGNTLGYSRPLGGGGDDAVWALRVLSNPTRIYVAGSTNSLSFPLKNPVRTPDIINGYEAFLCRFEITNFTPFPSLAFSTILGGNNDDGAKAVDVDSFGNMYVGGRTNSKDLANRSNEFQGGSLDAFVIRINANGTWAWSRYVGNTGTDELRGLAVVPGVGLALVGMTTSPNINPLFSSTVLLGGPSDAFLVMLNTNGFPTSHEHIGGTGGMGANGVDFASGVAVAPTTLFTPGRIYVVGSTNSTNFYTTIGSPPSGTVQDSFVLVKSY